ncbi:MAG TPA: DUF4232 domain-containing protein [Acidimicrobiales bacterium]|nr:DUF4232 domain-containing protein [Acidimicrobiales bacterium]
MNKVRSTVTSLALVGALLTGGLLGVGGLSAAATTRAKSCVSTQITVSRGAAQGTAGTNYYAIVFTNTGPHVNLRVTACTLFGVPTIQPVIGSSHRPLGPPARNESMGEMPALHTLAEGQSVSVAFGVVDTGNIAPSRCGARKGRGVVVTLGTFVRPTYLNLPITVCTKRASTTTRLISPGVTGN